MEAGAGARPCICTQMLARSMRRLESIFARTRALINPSGHFQLNRGPTYEGRLHGEFNKQTAPIVRVPFKARRCRQQHAPRHGADSPFRHRQSGIVIRDEARLRSTATLARPRAQDPDVQGSGYTQAFGRLFFGIFRTHRNAEADYRQADKAIVRINRNRTPGEVLIGRGLSPSLESAEQFRQKSGRPRRRPVRCESSGSIPT